MNYSTTAIRIGFVALYFLGNLNSSAASPQPLLNYSGKDRFEVKSSSYHLVADMSEAGIFVLNGEQSDTLFYLHSFDVEYDGVVYQADFQTYKPDLHVVRMGAWMTELHIENVVFSHGQNNWEGLGEISIFCYPDEIFFATDYICNAQEWIVRDEGKYLYPARPGFSICEGCFLLYPNPAQHWVQIEHDAPFGLYVYNIRGVIVESIQLPGSVRLPLSLSSGLYFFYLVSDKEGIVDIQKVFLI